MINVFRINFVMCFKIKVLWRFLKLLKIKMFLKFSEKKYIRLYFKVIINMEKEL